MKKISFWARNHRWSARMLIVVGHILLIWLAWYVGSGLRELGVQIPSLLLYVFTGFFVASIVCYPSAATRKRVRHAVAYAWQKSCDFSLLLFSFCMMVSIVNNPVSSLDHFKDVRAASEAPRMSRGEKPTAQEILASLRYRDKSTLTKSEKRILKKEFKKQLKVYAKAKLEGRKADADDAGLIILAIIAALGLLFLLSALVCSISCGGAEGLAVVVALLGTAAIIIGLILVIRAIRRGGRRRRGTT